MRLGDGTGPLSGLKVVELAGLGPGPHACMTLADLGADVIRVERPGGGALGGGPLDLLARGRPSVAIDLKQADGVRVVLDLASRADVLVEGFRPGAAERMGVGPSDCRAVNPRLVYARMTGWGQEGPLSLTAGHDITYLATAGVLHGLGQDQARPHFPSNLLGDFGGGSMYLVMGILAALFEARTSGLGQTVDAAIIDGARHLAVMMDGMRADGTLPDARAQMFVDGGVPYYDLYVTSDGRHMAVGALEPQFFRTFVALMGLESECPDQHDRARYEEMRALFARTFAGRTQAEWTALFEGTDACVAPVLTPGEADKHPQLVSRQTVVESDGVAQAATAPRFSRTPASLGRPPAPRPGTDTRAALGAWRVNDIEDLLARGVIVQT